jgi:hypothetical protein
MAPDRRPIADMIKELLAFLALHPDQARRHREESLRRAIKAAGRKGGPHGR